MEKLKKTMILQDYRTSKFATRKIQHTVKSQTGFLFTNTWTIPNQFIEVIGLFLTYRVRGTEITVENNFV